MSDPVLDIYTGQVRGFVVGVDAHWAGPPAGLGVPGPDTADLAGETRTIGGRDRVRRRLIKVPILLAVDDASVVEAVLDDAKYAWRNASDDTTLDLRLDGRQVRYYGRTRGLEADVEHHHDGVVDLVGNFEALDPWGYGTEVTETAETSPLTIAHPGTAPTARAVLTITGDGGSPEVTNLDDPDGGALTFTEALAGGSSFVVDLAAMTVVSGVSLTNREDAVDPASEWFALQPGTNRLTFTGCANVSVTYRPGWL